MTVNTMNLPKCEEYNKVAMNDCEKNIPSDATIYVVSHFCYADLRRCRNCQIAIKCPKIK